MPKAPAPSSAPSTPPPRPVPTTSAQVRAHLLSALEADLIGPFDGDPASAEVLSLPPSRFYLTGFLAPSGASDPGDPTEDDEFGAGDDASDEEQSDSAPEPKVRKLFASSMGFSVLLAPGDSTQKVTLSLRYANYDSVDADELPEGRTRAPKHWTRSAMRRPTRLTVALDPATLAVPVEFPGTEGVFLEGKLTTLAATPGVPAGARALSLFVVNNREAPPTEKPGPKDSAFIFQVCLELHLEKDLALLPRASRRDEGADELDDSVADLQYRDRAEWAVGHGVSTEPIFAPDGVTVVGVRSSWLPRSEVRPVVSTEVQGVTTSMEELAALPTGASVKARLAPMLSAYADWIEAQRAVPLDSPERERVRTALLADASHARARIEEGLDLLASEKHPELFEAFVLANRAMAQQARKRDPARYAKPEDVPRWRLFQLAFLLLNIAGLHDPSHPDRARVELIFFPTGGGKTEAYLGVIAFLLVLRRMRGRGRPDGGYGVAVLLRYTLRLLTLDQLQRAATLVCALELLRREKPERLGDVRFTVGLWVGRTATANTLSEVGDKITQWKNQADNKKAPSPLPFTQCPWCNSELRSSNVDLMPSKANPTSVRVLCGNFRGCDFGRASGTTDQGLPIVFVDEQIYRELPSFLIATVDKFAMVPWRAEAGMLFGRVHSRVGPRFFGPPDSEQPERSAALLPQGLLPPELIVQDELHLISGPLGTMVGLYETAVEALCTYTPEGTPTSTGAKSEPVRPKLLASTATVRRARRQVRSLFGREDVSLFPPPGISEGETFFARVDHSADGRLYVGVAAGGRAMKAVLLRVYVALLAAGWKYAEGGPHVPVLPPSADGKSKNPADPYVTVVGYFNALRELGGMRRLVEDEVRARCSRIEERRPVDEPKRREHRWFRGRELGEPVELTSRESTHSIARTRGRLGLAHGSEEHVDVLLASNMISVGVDIDRLGLMVVAGQPKTTSEYIQATSRVGRDRARPGLVVTVLNLHKPRDRSHYERFAAFHQSFYRHVEAMSLTPFSAPALERGFAGALLAMARHHSASGGALQPPQGVMQIEAHKEAVSGVIDVLAKRAGRERMGLDAQAHAALVETLRQRGQSLLDSWVSIVRATREGAGERCWSPYDPGRKGKTLLHTVLDAGERPAGSDEARFAAPTSMRDVEPTVHIWVERSKLEIKRRPGADDGAAGGAEGGAQ